MAERKLDPLDISRCPTTGPSAVSPRVVTVEEARTILQLSRMSVLKLIDDGDLRAVRFGRAIRIPLSSIEQLLGEGKGETQ